MQLNVAAAIQLAHQRLMEGNPRGAEQLCRQILSAAPNHALASRFLGAALTESQQFEEAIAILNRLSAARPGDAELLGLLGNAIAKSGGLDQGIDLLERSVRLSPDAPAMQWHLNQAVQLRMLVAGGRPAAERRLPYLGDRVVLLHCDRATREALRPSGLHGGWHIDPADGADRWLNILLSSGDGPPRLAARAEAWIQWLRDEAAMLGEVATVWSPRLPESFAALVRRIAGADLIEAAGAAPPEILAQLAARAVPPPPTAGKIFALVSIRNGGVELLPHWLEHYTRLGADELLVGVFSDVNESVHQELDRCAKQWKFQTFTQRWHDAVEAQHYVQRRTGCRKAGALPQTWIVHTDLDEFHQYPAPLRQIADVAGQKGIRAVSGGLIDRVAADGSLPPIRSTPPLWEQFPVECRLTERIGGAQTEKVMLARFGVSVTVGHHTPFNVRPAPPVAAAADYRVAHFKWHDQAVPRMRWAMQRPNAHPVWKREAQKLLKWLDENGGRINLDDPALEAKGASRP
jgi:hypothetical protein